MAEREKTDYHGRVMNMRENYPADEIDTPLLRTAYKFGHRDARHAAAEAVVELEAERDELLEALEALEKMAAECDDGQYIDYTGARAIFEDARAAIAKAYGESND